MQKLLLLVFVFLLVNAALVLAHIAIFQGAYPKLSWLSMLLHAVILLIIPYKTIIKNANN